MNKTIAIMALALCSCAAQAQETHFLSNNHVMQRINTSSKYLLLPVEESQDNDHIRVIQNNRTVKTFNCKLAVTHTDYFVPLLLDDLAEGQAVLDITLNRGNATAPSGGQIAVKDFSCWKQIKYADQFDTINREPWRPAYHHTPLYGWMNDPNGMFYKDGTWHLYYQYNPYGSQWENMTWGHSTSTDLVHWNYQGTPIEPDDLGTIFSGSCVVDHNNTAGFGAGAVIAYYTSAGATQMQSMAYSTDNGHTFTKYEGNPVLTSDIADFRDPHVFWNAEAGFWNLILSESQHMKIYSSRNLKDWTYESDFGDGYGCHDGVWECPDLMKMDDKWVLLCNINPGGPFGGSATQYFVGSFDGHRFICDSKPEVTKWMDYGKDHYATVSFDNAPDGRRVALPWMSNWQYANQVPTKQYRSANGLPRDLGLYTYNGESYLSVKPSREVMDVFATKPSSRLSEACRIDVQLKGNATITLSNEQGEQVVMTYDAKNETFAMDRSKSGKNDFSDDFNVVTQAPTRGKIKTLQLFVDRSSVEAFDGDGRMSMSNIVFPSTPYTHLAVKGGKAKIYPMKP